MAPPLSVRTQGGPWDVIYRIGDNAMGFITRGPASRAQVSNTAPRIRVGGDPAYAEGTFDQLVLLGFETGQDLERFDSGDRRVQYQDGNVALYMPGRVTLASQWAKVDTVGAAVTAPRVIDFMPAGKHSYVVIGANDRLRVWDDDDQEWEDQGTFTAPVRHLYANDQYLFASFGADADAMRWDGTDGGGWTTLTGIKADAFGWFHEKLIRGFGNKIFFANTDNNGNSWGAGTEVGWESTDIEDLFVYNDYLLIAKPEGLYIYDGNEVYQLIDATATRSTGNFVGSTSWQGALYTPWLSTLNKIVITSVRFSTVADITPTMTGDADKERYGHGVPKVAFAGPRQLFIGMNGGEGKYPELLMYNGIGFHQVYRGPSGSTLFAAGYSRLKGWLIVCVSDGVYRKRIINTALGEYADYAPTGYFITPKLDGGYPDEIKAWRSVTVDAVDVDMDNTIQLYYRADGGPWTLFGTITSEGPNEVPLAGADGQVSAREMEFQFKLTRAANDITATPRIELPIVIRLLVSPTAVDAFAETIVVDENQLLRNGAGRVGDVYTEADMLAFLDRLADTPQTIKRTDEWGRTFRVKVTDKVEEETRDPGRTSRSMNVSLRMMEMFSGVTLADSVDGPLAAVSETVEEFDDWLTDADGVGLMDSKGFLLREAA